jgi:hydrogenase expression/formation protein HypD
MNTQRVLKAIGLIMQSLQREVNLMEVCGTHTVSIFRHGIRGLLRDWPVRFLSGPGCPVCVTAQEDVDRAIMLARRPGVLLCTFGDMMRVPGALGSLQEARARGARVEVVYSPLDALRRAEKGTETVVFYATGFETTAPSVAAVLLEAEERGIENFLLYSVHKLVPPALEALLQGPCQHIDGFILPGHVSTVIGSRVYDFIAERYSKPAVVAGFEAQDILEATLMLLDGIKARRPEVQVQYSRAVRPEGNPRARALMREVFTVVDAYWRGIGVIPSSGLSLGEAFAHRDALRVFAPELAEVPKAGEPRGCACADVLRGLKLPPDCALFGRRCTPEHPVGACMVSTEGSCAAYYKYGGGNG